MFHECIQAIQADLLWSVSYYLFHPSLAPALFGHVLHLYALPGYVTIVAFHFGEDECHTV